MAVTQAWPAYAQIEPDGRSATSVSRDGATVDVRTGTTHGDVGVNSFRRFGVRAGETVNMHLPDGTGSLINLVREGVTDIDGVLNALKNGAVGGELVIANPHGVTIGAGGVVNAGALRLETPTAGFVDGFFDEAGQPRGEAIDELLNGRAPLADSHVTVDGRVNASKGVDVRTGGNVSISGVVDVDARRQMIAQFANVGADGAAPDTADGSGATADTADSGGETAVPVAPRIAVEAGQDIEIGFDAEVVARATGESGPAQISLRPARDIAVRQGATVSVDGWDGADAGELIVFAGRDSVLEVGATLTASAHDGGDGGFVEFSGAYSVTVEGELAARAPEGEPGRILIDPVHIFVGSDVDTDGADYELIADETITVQATVATEGGDFSAVAGESIALNGGTQIVTDGGDMLFQAGSEFDFWQGMLSTRRIGSSTNYAFGSSTGDSGNVTVEAPSIGISSGTEIYAQATGSHAGGTVTLSASDTTGGENALVARAGSDIAVRGDIRADAIMLSAQAAATVSVTAQASAATYDGALSGLPDALGDALTGVADAAIDGLDSVGATVLPAIATAEATVEIGGATLTARSAIDIDALAETTVTLSPNADPLALVGVRTETVAATTVSGSTLDARSGTVDIGATTRERQTLGANAAEGLAVQTALALSVRSASATVEVAPTTTGFTRASRLQAPGGVTIEALAEKDFDFAATAGQSDLGAVGMAAIASFGTTTATADVNAEITVEGEADVDLDATVRYDRLSAQAEVGQGDAAPGGEGGALSDPQVADEEVEALMARLEGATETGPQAGTGVTGGASFGAATVVLRHVDSATATLEGSVSNDLFTPDTNGNAPSDVSVDATVALDAADVDAAVALEGTGGAAGAFGLVYANLDATVDAGMTDASLTMPGAATVTATAAFPQASALEPSALTGDWDTFANRSGAEAGALATGAFAPDPQPYAAAAPFAARATGAGNGFGGGVSVVALRANTDVDAGIDGQSDLAGADPTYSNTGTVRMAGVSVVAQQTGALAGAAGRPDPADAAGTLGAGVVLGNLDSDVAAILSGAVASRSVAVAARDALALVGVASAGAAGDAAAVAPSLALLSATRTTSAAVAASAGVDASGTLTISAVDEGAVIAAAGSLATGAATAVGTAGAIVLAERNVYAGIGQVRRLEEDSQVYPTYLTGPQAETIAISAEDRSVTAASAASGEEPSAPSALAEANETPDDLFGADLDLDGLDDNTIATPDGDGPAEGAQWGFALSGAGAVVDLDTATVAGIRAKDAPTPLDAATVTARATGVGATAAGGATPGAASAGIGVGIAVTDADIDVLARLAGPPLTDGSLTLTATDDTALSSVAAGASGGETAGNAALAGSYAEVDALRDAVVRVDAVDDPNRPSTLTPDSLTADATTAGVSRAVAGGLQAAGEGFGGGLTLARVTGTNAPAIRISDTTLDTPGAVVLRARDTGTVDALTASLADGGGVTLQGSAALTDVTRAPAATLTDADLTAQALTVLAETTSSTRAVSGAALQDTGLSVGVAYASALDPRTPGVTIADSALDATGGALDASAVAAGSTTVTATSGTEASDDASFTGVGAFARINATQAPSVTETGSSVEGDSGVTLAAEATTTLAADAGQETTAGEGVGFGLGLAMVQLAGTADLSVGSTLSSGSGALALTASRTPTATAEAINGEVEADTFSLGVNVAGLIDRGGAALTLNGATLTADGDIDADAVSGTDSTVAAAAAPNADGSSVAVGLAGIDAQTAATVDLDDVTMTAGDRLVLDATEESTATALSEAGGGIEIGAQGIGNQGGGPQGGDGTQGGDGSDSEEVPFNLDVAAALTGVTRTATLSVDASDLDAGGGASVTADATAATTAGGSVSAVADLDLTQTTLDADSVSVASNATAAPDIRALSDYAARTNGNSDGVAAALSGIGAIAEGQADLLALSGAAAIIRADADLDLTDSTVTGTGEDGTTVRADANTNVAIDPVDAAFSIAFVQTDTDAAVTFRDSRAVSTGGGAVVEAIVDEEQDLTATVGGKTTAANLATVISVRRSSSTVDIRGPAAQPAVAGHTRAQVEARSERDLDFTVDSSTGVDGVFGLAALASFGQATTRVDLDAGVAVTGDSGTARVRARTLHQQQSRVVARSGGVAAAAEEDATASSEGLRGDVTDFAGSLEDAAALRSTGDNDEAEDADSPNVGVTLAALAEIQTDDTQVVVGARAAAAVTGPIVEVEADNAVLSTRSVVGALAERAENGAGTGAAGEDEPKSTDVVVSLGYQTWRQTARAELASQARLAGDTVTARAENRMPGAFLLPSEVRDDWSGFGIDNAQAFNLDEANRAPRIDDVMRSANWSLATLLEGAAGDVGVAVEGAVVDARLTAETVVRDGADLDAGSTGTVAVEAGTSGLVDVGAGLADRTTAGLPADGTAVGARGGVALLTTDVDATVEAGAQLTGDTVRVDAADDTILAAGAAGAAGAGDVSVEAAVALARASQRVDATLRPGAEVAAGTLEVDASAGGALLADAGVESVSNTAVAVGVALTISDLEVGATLAPAPAGGAAGATALQADTLTLTATDNRTVAAASRAAARETSPLDAVEQIATSGELDTPDLAGGTDISGLTDPLESVSASVDGQDDTVGFTGAGDAAANLGSVTVVATLSDPEARTDVGDATVTGERTGLTVAAASGAVQANPLSENSTGVSVSFGANALTTTTRAFATDFAGEADALSLTARESGTSRVGAVGKGGPSLKADAVVGSGALVRGARTVEARLSGTAPAGAPDLTLLAERTGSTAVAAGSAQISGGFSIGASFADLNQEATTRAELTAGGTFGDVSVTATDAQEVVTNTASLGGGQDFNGGGAVSNTRGSRTVEARLNPGGQASVIADSARIEAQSTGTSSAIAGSLQGSLNAQAVGVGISRIAETRTVTAEQASGTLDVTGGSAAERVTVLAARSGATEAFSIGGAISPQSLALALNSASVATGGATLARLAGTVLAERAVSVTARDTAERDATAGAFNLGNATAGIAFALMNDFATVEAAATGAVSGTAGLSVDASASGLRRAQTYGGAFNVGDSSADLTPVVALRTGSVTAHVDGLTADLDGTGSDGDLAVTATDTADVTAQLLRAQGGAGNAGAVALALAVQSADVTARAEDAELRLEGDLSATARTTDGNARATTTALSFYGSATGASAITGIVQGTVVARDVQALVADSFVDVDGDVAVTARRADAAIGGQISLSIASAAGGATFSWVDVSGATSARFEGGALSLVDGDMTVEATDTTSAQGFAIGVQATAGNALSAGFGVVALGADPVGLARAEDADSASTMDALQARIDEADTLIASGTDSGVQLDRRRQATVEAVVRADSNASPILVGGDLDVTATADTVAASVVGQVGISFGPGGGSTNTVVSTSTTATGTVVDIASTTVQNPAGVAVGAGLGLTVQGQTVDALVDLDGGGRMTVDGGLTVTADSGGGTTAVGVGAQSSTNTAVAATFAGAFDDRLTRARVIGARADNPAGEATAGDVALRAGGDARVGAYAVVAGISASQAGVGFGIAAASDDRNTVASVNGGVLDSSAGVLVDAGDRTRVTALTLSGGVGNATAAGVSAAIAVGRSATDAAIVDAQVTAADTVRVRADDSPPETTDAFGRKVTAVSLPLSVGTGGVAIGAAFAVAELDGQTTAGIVDSTVTSTGGDVAVEADAFGDASAITLGAAIGNNAVSGSLSFAVRQDTVSAGIEGATVEADDAVLVQAVGRTGAINRAGAQADETLGAVPDDLDVTLTIGNAAGVGFNLGLVANRVDVLARIGAGSEVVANNHGTGVDAFDGGIDSDGRITRAAARGVQVLGHADTTISTIAFNASVSGTVGVSAQVGFLVLAETVTAEIAAAESGARGPVEDRVAVTSRNGGFGTGRIAVKATAGLADEPAVGIVAGGGAAGIGTASVGVGVSSTTVVSRRDVRARIVDATATADGALEIVAASHERIDVGDLGAGFGLKFGGGAAVTVVRAESEVEAYAQGADLTGFSVSMDAGLVRDIGVATVQAGGAKIASVAGALSVVSAEDTVFAGTRDGTSGDRTTIDATWTVVVDASSEQTVSLAPSAGNGALVGVGGTVGVVGLDTSVRARIGAYTRVNAAQDPVIDSVRIAATRTETLDIDVGSLQLGFAAAGASVMVASMTGLTEAAVGRSAEVYSDDDVLVEARNTRDLDADLNSRAGGFTALNLSIADVAVGDRNDSSGYGALLVGTPERIGLNEEIAADPTEGTGGSSLIGRGTATTESATADAVGARRAANPSALFDTTRTFEDRVTAVVERDAVVESGEDIEIEAVDDTDVVTELGALALGGNSGIAGTGRSRVETAVSAIVQQGARLQADNYDDITVVARTGGGFSDTATNEMRSWALPISFFASGSLAAAIAETNRSVVAAIEPGALIGTDAERAGVRVEADGGSETVADLDTGQFALQGAAGLGTATAQDETRTSASIGLYAEQTVGGTGSGTAGDTVVRAHDMEVVAFRGGDVTATGGNVAGSVLVGASIGRVTATDLGTATATLGGAADIDTRFDVDLEAGSWREVTATFEGVSVAGGIAVDLSRANARSARTIAAGIADGARVNTGSDLDVLARDGNPSANNIRSLTRATATGVAGAVLAGGGIRSTAENTSTVQANVNGGRLDVGDDLTVRASGAVDADAEADSAVGGVLAGGLARAIATNAPTVTARLVAGAAPTGVRVADLARVEAILDEATTTYAELGSGGVGTAAAARAETTSTPTVTVQIGTTNSLVQAGELAVDAALTSRFVTAADSTQAALIGVSGARGTSQVTPTLSVAVLDQANVEAEAVSVRGALDVRKQRRSGMDADLVSGSGGAIDTADVQSETVIDVARATFALGEGARLEQTGTDETMRVDLSADVALTDRVELDMTAGLAAAQGRSTVDLQDLRVAVDLAENATLRSAGDLDVTTQTDTAVVSESFIKAYGVAGAPVGSALARSYVDEAVTLAAGARIAGGGDVAVRTGLAPDGTSSSAVATAETRVFNKTAVPITLKPSSTAFVSHELDIEAATGSLLSAGDDLTLHTAQPVTDTYALARGIDAYREVGEAVINFIGDLVGAEDVSLDLIGNEDAFGVALQTVRVDGMAEAAGGLQRQFDFGPAAPQPGDGYSLLPDQPIGAAIRAEIDRLEALRTDYADQQDVLTGIDAQIAFLQIRLDELGNGDGTADVIALDPIQVESGELRVVTDTLRGTGTLRARSDAQIQVRNSSDWTLRTDAIALPFLEGGVFLNDVEIDDATQIAALQGDASSVLTVEGSDARSRMVDVVTAGDLIVAGDIENLRGTVRLESTGGAVDLIGDVRALDTQVVAAGLLSIGFQPGIRHLGGDPFDAYRPVFVAAENGASASFQGGIPQGNVGGGGLVQGGTVRIAGEYLNVNGTIRAGTVSSLIDQGQPTLHSVRIDPSMDAVLDGLNGTDRVLVYDADGLVAAPGQDDALSTLSLWYDPVDDRLEVEPLQIVPGEVHMVGKLLSTGQGRIEVLDGAGTIAIASQSRRDLELGALDTGAGTIGEGLVRLTDTFRAIGGGSFLTTEYTFDGTDVRIATNDGSAPRSVAGASARYFTSAVDGVDSPMLVYSRQEVVQDFLGAQSSVVEDFDPVAGVELRPTVSLFDDYSYSRTTTDIGNNTTRVLHTHAVRADRPIDIAFLGEDTGTLEVAADGDVFVAGRVSNTLGRTEIVSRDGDIRTEGSSGLIVADDLDLDADGAIGGVADRSFNLLARFGGEAGNGDGGDDGGDDGQNLAAPDFGDVFVPGLIDTFVAPPPTRRAALALEMAPGGRVNAQASGDIALRETVGALDIEEVRSTGGDVRIDAVGDIAGTTKDPHVFGGAVSLASETGSIGTAGAPLEVSESGGLTASAQGDIAILSPASLDVVSVESRAGDVYLTADHEAQRFASLHDANDVESVDRRAEAALLNALFDTLGLQGSAALARADASVAALEAAAEAEYRRYWALRNVQPDGNGGYTADAYDPGFVYTVSAERRDTLRQRNGWSEQQIDAFAADRTAFYHAAHQRFGGQAYEADYEHSLTPERSAEVRRGAGWTTGELDIGLRSNLVLGTADTQTRVEAPNVVGRNVTLAAQYSVGERAVSPLTVRDGDVLTRDLLVALAAAERDDIRRLPDRIQIEQVDDLDVSTSGVLRVTAVQDVFVGSEGDLTVEAVQAGAVVRIKAGGALSGAGTGSVEVTATDIVVEAGGGDLGSQADPLRVAPNGGTLVARAAGNLWIEAPTTGLTLDGVFAGGTASLAASGALDGTSGSDGVDLLASDILLQAGTTIGTADALGVQLSAPGGAVSANAVGDVDLHVTATTFDLAATRSFEGDVTVAASGDLRLASQAPGLRLPGQPAMQAAGTARLDAQGSVFDAGAGEIDVRASHFSAILGDELGTPGNPVETQVGSASLLRTNARTPDGDSSMTLVNRGDLRLTRAISTDTQGDARSISVGVSAGDLILDTAFDLASGSLRLEAQDAGNVVFADDTHFRADTVEILAGDSISIAARTAVTADGDLTLTGGRSPFVVGDVEAEGIGVVDRGSLQADGRLTVEGPAWIDLGAVTGGSVELRSDNGEIVALDVTATSGGAVVEAPGAVAVVEMEAAGNAFVGSTDSEIFAGRVTSGGTAWLFGATGINRGGTPVQVDAASFRADVFDGDLSVRFLGAETQVADVRQFGTGAVRLDAGPVEPGDPGRALRFVDGTGPAVAMRGGALTVLAGELAVDGRLETGGGGALVRSRTAAIGAGGAVSTRRSGGGGALDIVATAPAGDILMAATARLDAGGGTVDIDAGGTVRLGRVSGDAGVTVNAGRLEVGPATAVAAITANGQGAVARLRADSVSYAPGAYLPTQVDTLDMVVGSGDLRVLEADALQLARAETGDGAVEVGTFGDLAVGSVAAGVPARTRNPLAGRAVLNAGASLFAAPGARVQAETAHLYAEGAIGSLAAPLALDARTVERLSLVARGAVVAEFGALQPDEFGKVLSDTSDVALDLPRATTIETLGAAGAVDFTGVTPRVRADGTQRLVDIRPQPGRPLMLDARYTQRPVRARESAPLDREGQEIDPGAGLQAVFGDGFRAPLTPDSLTPADGRPVRPVQPVRSAGPVAPSLSELPAPTLGFNGPNGAFVFGDGTQLPADALTGLVRAIRGANAGRGPAALGPGGGGAGGNAAAGDPGAGAGAIARAFGGLIATRDPSVARSATVIVNPTIADDLNEARPDDATLDRFLEETQ